MTSELRIFDLATGASRLLLRTTRHIEAPNWAADGRLLVNSGGRLFWFDPGKGDLQQLDTGFAEAINNDHGISPDGSQIAISDASRTEKSAVYLVPLEGGKPHRVTQAIPSYWHGWSPDGAQLAYVGNRGAGFQVFTCPAGGGEERQVTAGFTHCDGPDYTPDGEWIWFNGELGGVVELWRVRPDGTGLEKMTEDERQNWFPHPSPDGRRVVYLAYAEGLWGHPADQEVELRMIPAEGGVPEVLACFRGGQGTINVPSWSPDSQSFAYVVYPEAVSAKNGAEAVG